jgi:hypothetical protein
VETPHIPRDRDRDRDRERERERGREREGETEREQFKSQAYGGEVILLLFWNCNEPTLEHHLKQGTTVTAAILTKIY